VWTCWNYLSKVRPFSKVDDALGVIYTHGIAGFFGGLLLGVFGDPGETEYGCGHLDANGQVVHTSNALYNNGGGGCSPFSVHGLMYTGSWGQVWQQFRAAIFVIFWSALITFILMKLINLILPGGARYSEDILEIGDVAIHDEEAYPEPAFSVRSGGAFAMAGIEVGSLTPPTPTDSDPPPGQPPSGERS
jgi:ammonium transporter, Amt family